MQLITALDAHVTATEFGERWPLSLPEGRVIAGIYQGAEGFTVALAFEASDKTWYGLNGVARTYLIGRDITTVWLLVERESVPDSLEVEERKDLSPLLYLGLSLAEAEGYGCW